MSTGPRPLTANKAVKPGRRASPRTPEGTRRAGWDEARRDLHEALARPAVYRPPGEDPKVPGGKTVHVRLTVAPRPVWPSAASGGFHAGRVDMAPEIVFRADEQVPARGAHVVFAADEVYRVDTVWPRTGITVTAVCVRIQPAA